MKLIDPTVRAPERVSHRAPRLASIDGLTVGLLANGKVNADLLLQETAALFQARHGCTVAPILSKSNASAPAPTQTIHDVASGCDFMLTAMGD